MCTAATSIKLLTVTDVDSSSLTISITAGDDASNKFSFNAGNNKLIETSANAIDYEALTAVNYKYTLVVEATDGTATATATVIVTVMFHNAINQPGIFLFRLQTIIFVECIELYNTPKMILLRHLFIALFIIFINTVYLWV